MAIRGFVIWITGLPCSGKSTLAAGLIEVFAERGIPCELLDSDVTRTRLSQGLGFSREDRDANVERLGFVAELLARHGVAVVVAAISPYRVTRARLRCHITRYVEVFADCPVAECERRDTNGMYAEARAGSRKGFTGVDDPYEPPDFPEVRLRTDTETIQESLRRIVATLSALELIGE